MIIFHSKLELVNLVHIQRNDAKTKPARNNTYYFVEMDIRFKEGNSTIFRASHFVKPTSAGDLCFIKDFTIRPNVEINLLTPIKNQKRWLLYMLQMLQEIIVETHEKHVSIPTSKNCSKKKPVWQSVFLCI